VKMRKGGSVLWVAAAVVGWAAVAQAANGAPSGAHYNLNLIGVPKDKTSEMTDTNRHTIFVPLTGNCTIRLAEGDFSVLDGNCTDGSSSFQLPNPDPDGDGTTTYSVFARALGKPGGSSTTTTCATDPADGSTVCSVLPLTLIRTKGKQTFQNVSKNLLYIYADIDGNGSLDRVSLFDSRLRDYFWYYDNNGLKLAQFRFYECATIVPDPSDPNGQQIDTDCFD